MRILFHTLALLIVTNLAHAETPNDFLALFEKEAGGKANAERGGKFFTSRHGTEWSCSSCHTKRPTQTGSHAKTNKPIKPLAPAANPERFTNAGKVDKWFHRNCDDTVGRECSAQEKADVLAWLLTFKP